MTIQYRIVVAVILLLVAEVVPANYAVIIQDDSSKTYYKTLKKRGFIDENIYREKLVPIQELQGKINKSPAPFYLIMLGKDDSIDISNWLDELEAGLNEEAKKQARVVILSNTIKGISKAGRVIISSAAADEKVSDGPNSDNIFMENFFQHLARGVSIKKAFEKASNITKNFTHDRKSCKTIQNPLIEINGNFNNLSLGINNIENEADIVRVTETLYLKPNESATLFAEVNNLKSVRAATINVQVPSSKELEKIVLFSRNKRCETNTDEVKNIFKEPGRYDLYYWVTDKQSFDISPLQHSVLYRNKEDNKAPAPFDLIAPKDGGTVLITSPVTFEWEQSIDPDDDAVSYTLEIAKDAEFEEVVYSQEGICGTEVTVDLKELESQETYYWRMVAVDENGAKRSSEGRIITTENCQSFGQELGSKNGQLCVFYDSNCNCISDGNYCVHITIEKQDSFTTATYFIFNILTTFENVCPPNNISTESYPRSLAFFSSELKVNIPMLGTWKYQGGSRFNKVAYESGCSCP